MYSLVVVLVCMNLHDLQNNVESHVHVYTFCNVQIQVLMCLHVHVISDFKITVIEYISYICTLNTLHLCIVHCTLYVYYVVYMYCTVPVQTLLSFHLKPGALHVEAYYQ